MATDILSQNGYGGLEPKWLRRSLAKMAPEVLSQNGYGGLGPKWGQQPHSEAQTQAQPQAQAQTQLAYMLI